MRAERAIIQFEDLLHNEVWPAEISMTKREADFDRQFTMLTAYELSYDAEKRSPNEFCKTIAPHEVRRSER